MSNIDTSDWDPSLNDTHKNPKPLSIRELSNIFSDIMQSYEMFPPKVQFEVCANLLRTKDILQNQSSNSEVDNEAIVLNHRNTFKDAGSPSFISTNVYGHIKKTMDPV